MREFLAALRQEAWRTAGARYNAARRLSRRELFSTVSLAMFSAISVAIAFLQRIYVTSGSPTDNYLTALSACLGVLLLTVSLMEWGARTGAKAEALHRNAEDLNALQRAIALSAAQLDAGEPTTWAAVESLRARYEDVKSRCAYNHEPVDDAFFRVSHRHSKEFLKVDGKPAYGGFESFCFVIRWYYASVWYFGLFWIIVAASIAGVTMLPAVAR